MSEPTNLPIARQPKVPIVIPDRVCLRALRRFDLDEETGCHVSTYSTASHGYAQIGWHEASGVRHVVLAHRAAWVAVHGQIPEGMTVDHTCKNRRCVNVAHLRLLSNFENARRTAGRDWPLGQCIHGHSNDRLVKRSGKWMCADCSAEWHRTYNRSRKGADS